MEHIHVVASTSPHRSHGASAVKSENQPSQSRGLWRATSGMGKVGNRQEGRPVGGWRLRGDEAKV